MRVMLCVCDVANWQSSMTAGLRRFGPVGVLTQLWCARVPVVIVLACCFTSGLHGTRCPRTTVQLRVGIGVALFASCRVARSVTHAYHGTPRDCGGLL